MLEIDVIIEEKVSGLVKADIERMRMYAREALSRNGVSIGEINIVFIDDEFMAELNETYKGRSGATDVLSFNLTNEFFEGLSGEIYISPERANAQADELGISREEETIRLLTHGLLHLAGHIHDTEERHAIMTRRTDELVGKYFTGWSDK